MARRAKKNFMPNELIYSGYPYVVAVKKGSYRCEYCFKLSFELKLCKKCLFARYCQKWCQIQAWPDHKLECRFLKKFPECRQPLLVRLISLLILKIKGKKWEDIYEYVEGEKVSFADVWSNFQGRTKSPQYLLYLKEISVALNKYLGPEKLPSQEKMFEMIDKVEYNALCLEKNAEVPDVLALYLGIGNIHPSCIPNAQMLSIDVTSRKVELRTSSEICKNDEFTLNKYNFILTLRPEKLQPTIDECKCDDCLQPYGESVLTKILDDTVAYSVIMETEALLRRASLCSCTKNNLEFQKKVNEVLLLQEDVLGNTHFLRLRLLALKVFHMEINIFEKIVATDKLFNYTKEAFGEHHNEVRIIGSALQELERQFNENFACRIL